MCVCHGIKLKCNLFIIISIWYERKLVVEISTWSKVLKIVIERRTKYYKTVSDMGAANTIE